MIPYSADYINAAASQIQPGTIRCQDATLTRFFRRYLMDRAISVFRWGMPKTWVQPYVLYTLFGIGFFSIIETDKFGVIPQDCTLRGRGVQYQPTGVLITNPLIDQTLEPTIGVNCTLIRLRPDYGGILDLIYQYAEAMAVTYQLFLINSINSRVSYVATAEDKRGAESLKKGFDRLYAGDPMVVLDKSLYGVNGEPAWTMLLQNVQQNYVASDVLQNLRRLECMFDNEIGIPANLATDKKERTISAEVEANDVETYGRAAAWLESLKQGCAEAREMFGINLTVDWRVDPLKSIGEETRDNARNTVTNGPVQSG